MAPLPPLPKAVQPTTSTLLAPVVAASAAAVLGHIEKRVDFGKAAGDAMGAVQNAGETVVNKAPDALQNVGETVAEKAPDALKKAGDAVADTAKTVAGKAVDLAKQVVDLGFKEMIEKWLKSFLKELLRKYWKWLLILRWRLLSYANAIPLAALAILLYYLGKLIFLWWKATRRQRTAHRLYREYVRAPPDCKFSTILKKRGQKKVFSARMRRWLKRIRRAIWLRLRMLTTGQKKAALEQKDKVKRQLRADCKEHFEDDEEGRWNKFREELKKLEKTCVDEAIRADPTATDEKSREGIKGKVRRKTRGALRSYFRPGRLGGWIPDITCMGMWDRRRFFNSNIRGMKRLHFCNLMRQVIDVVAMANSRRDTRKVWDLEARLRIKEEADRLKVEKKAIEMANNSLKPSEKVNNRLSGDTFIEKGEKNKRWPGRSAATAGGKK
ncbi:hypothetical protein QFC21_000410 [Naganishia friedmannii]|uniref:Uncharacterized protein n=1 Tax=Naganishia friedmannii TaxID=89922 RepID=A0ACC2WEW5_9TREE|nr:hypothetical protein QFC21_000410 [Naganishia friedmannii]